VPATRPGKAGGRRDANRKRRISQLIDSAVALFLERGITAVTIDAIVERAGVAKGSFYHYFGDKDELVAVMMAPVRDGFRAAMARCADRLARTESPDELPAAYLELAAGIARVIVQHPGLVRLYLQESRSPAVGARRPLRELADELTEGAIALSTVARDYGLLSDSDPRLGALTVIGAGEQILWAYLNGADLGPPAAIPRTLIAIILDGVRQRGLSTKNRSTSSA
jgi:AcrR family transcriptional regulator